MKLPLNQILLGDCLELLKSLPDDCIDSVVVDPPYGLGNKDPDPMDIFMYVLSASVLDTGGDFMGRNWSIPSVAVWREVFRVLKPGGYVASFGGTRTFDLISIGLRMAGFECRDTISRFYPDAELPVLQWVQSQGMPKSHAIGKAIDKKLGKDRKVVGSRPVAYPDTPSGYTSFSANSTARKGGIWHESTGESQHGRPVTEPASEEAAQWEGYGSALKPSWEPILLFRKPFKGTLADNVLEHGTGGLNIDATRVRHSSAADFEAHKKGVDAIKERGGSRDKSWKNSSDLSGANEVTSAGRWPANALLEHSDRCRKIGTQEIAPHPQGPDRFQKTSGGDFSDAYGNQQASDEPEVSPIWECAEGCPVRELNEQSGDRPSTLTGRADPSTSHEHPGVEMNPNSAFLGERTHLSRVYADGGGAARFFTQFEGAESSGRWPPNVVLNHAEGCKRAGTRRVKGSHDARSNETTKEYGSWNSETFKEGFGFGPRAKNTHVSKDGLEEVESWECVEGCPVKAIDDQSGELRARGNVNPSQWTKDKGWSGGWSGEGESPANPGDAGGASRFFPQFEGESQGRWPGNVVLQHAEGCKRAGTKKVKGITGGTAGPRRKREVYAETGGLYTTGREQPPVKPYADAEGKEEVESWECVDGCPVKALDDQSGEKPSRWGSPDKEVNHTVGNKVYGEFKPLRDNPDYYADFGGASRFFSQFDGVPFKYVPKANRKEAGCGEFEVQHITLKPLSLIRWLVKLVTPKNGVVLDMYCGSGTTCHAATLEGMQFIGMERDETNHAEACKRLGIVLRNEQERKESEDLLDEALGG